MKQFISVAFIVLLTHAGFTQNYLHLWINSDTLMVGKDRILKLPVTIKCKGVGCSMIYSGDWQDTVLLFGKKPSPFFYTIGMDSKACHDIKLLRNTTNFLKTGYSPTTRVNAIKMKRSYRKLKSRNLNAKEGLYTILIKLSRKEVKLIKCSSSSTVALTYSSFIYNEKLVYPEKNNKPYMVLRKVKSNFDPVEVIKGGYSSNSVLINLSSTDL